MSSPQGAEVGRVTIRVLPDLGRFREEIEAAVASIDDVKINVDADTTKFRESVRLAREAVEANGATVTVNFDPDVGSLKAAIAAAKLQSANVSIKMNIDLQGAPLVLAELQAIDLIVDRLDGRNIRLVIDVDGLAEAVAELTALNALAASSSTSLNGSFTSAGSSAAGLGRSTLLVVAAFGALLALAGPLVAAGAAVTAAWGAAATAIAAIGPLVFGLAGIFAPIALGIDGIKAGFEGLTPTIDKLKKRLSDTFEKGIKDSIPGLKSIILELDDELIHIAESLTTALLIFTNIASQNTNIATLEGVFSHLRDAIVLLAEPLTTIFFTLAQVTDRFAAFNLIVGPIQNFADEFASSIFRLSIQSNTLDTALFGLEGTLESLTDGFIHLVENGMHVFAAAAPGVNQFLDSLTAFFNRFDWDRLGVAVGNVFSGMAEALDKVPPETIERITAGFEKLGDTFKDPAVQSGFAKLLDWVPGFLTEVDTLITKFSELITKLDEVRLAITTFVDDANKLADSLNSSLPEGVKKFAAGLDQSLDESLRKGLGLTPEEYGALVGDPLYAGLFKAGDRANEAAEIAFVRVDGKLIDVMTGQEVTVTTGMDGVAVAAAAGATKVADAMVPPAPNFIAGLASVFGGGAPVIDQQTGALAGNAAAGAANIDSSFQGGLAPIPGNAGATLAPVGQAADPGLTTLNNSMTTAWGTAQTTTQTGATNVGTEAGKTGPNITSSTSDLNSGLLAAAGKAVMQGFLDGLKSLWGTVQSFVSGIAPWVKGAKGPLVYDRKLLVPAGKAIMGGLGAGLRTGFGFSVAPFVSSVAPAIADTFSDMDTSFADTMSAKIDPQNTFSPELAATYSAAVQGEGVGAQVAGALAGWNVVIDSDGIAKLVNKSNTRRAAR